MESESNRVLQPGETGFVMRRGGVPEDLVKKRKKRQQESG